MLRIDVKSALIALALILFQAHADWPPQPEPEVSEDDPGVTIGIVLPGYEGPVNMIAALDAPKEDAAAKEDADAPLGAMFSPLATWRDGRWTSAGHFDLTDPQMRGFPAELSITAKEYWESLRHSDYVSLSDGVTFFHPEGIQEWDGATNGVYELRFLFGKIGGTALKKAGEISLLHNPRHDLVKDPEDYLWPFLAYNGKAGKVPIEDIRGKVDVSKLATRIV